MANITNPLGSYVSTTSSAYTHSGSSTHFSTQMQPHMQNYEVMTATQRTLEFLGRKVDKLVTWWYSSPQPTPTQAIGIQDFSKKQKARFDDRLDQAIDNVLGRWDKKRENKLVAIIRDRLNLVPFTPEEKVAEKERVDAILKERLPFKRFTYLQQLMAPGKKWPSVSEGALIPYSPSKTEAPSATSQSRLAFKQLKSHFLTAGISYKDRRDFVRELEKDLKGEMSDAEFAEALFNELPQVSWPLIFLHFDNYLSQSEYDRYYEEKSRGGAFKKVDKDRPHQMNPKAFNRYAEFARELVTNPDPMERQDASLWTEVAILDATFRELVLVTPKSIQNVQQWVEIAALALQEMIDNPFIKDEGEVRSAMQHLYQAACETNTIHLIMKRFIENTTAFRFVTTMARFERAAFSHNQEGFRTLLSESLEGAKIDITEYIADSIKVNDSWFNYNLLKLPLLQDERLRAAIAKKLAQAETGLFRMGRELFTLFRIDQHTSSLLIKSLKNTDKAYCTELFYDLSFALYYMKPEIDKFRIFQSMCEDYAEAGFDVLMLLQDDKAPIELLTELYVPENLVKYMHPSVVGLQLIQYIAPDQLYPTLIQHVEKIFEETTFPDFHFGQLQHFMKAVTEFGVEKTFVAKLLEHPAACGLVQHLMDTNFIEAISKPDAKLYFPLLRTLVEDWQERVKIWIREEIKPQPLDEFTGMREIRIKDSCEFLSSLGIEPEIARALIGDAAKICDF